MNPVCIMQTRMGSTRLPGKVMKKINGKEILYYDIKRILSSKKINKLIVATTIHERDDIIVEYVESLKKEFPNLHYFRGSESNVLERYYLAAVEFKADPVIRITSDCPLADPEVIDLLLDEYEKKECDYLANRVKKRTWPTGLDTEIFSFKTLEKAMLEAKDEYSKEHVVPYILGNPEIFKLCEIPFPDGKDYSDIWITIDYPEDYESLKSFLEYVGKDNYSFTIDDIINYYYGPGKKFLKGKI